MRRRMSSCSECCLSPKGHRTHFPLKKMERSVCMYVHMWVCTYRTQRGPERPREARRRAERPREAQRGPEKPRETQRGPKRPRKACMYIPGPFQEHSHKQNYEQNCLAMYVYVCICTFQDHSRSIHTSKITARIALLYVCMYMCMYVG